MGIDIRNCSRNRRSAGVHRGSGHGGSDSEIPVLLIPGDLRSFVDPGDIRGEESAMTAKRG
jgi:hypothetical protein